VVRETKEVSRPRQVAATAAGANSKAGSQLRAVRAVGRITIAGAIVSRSKASHNGSLLVARGGEHVVPNGGVE
jgi:hypothetical protein